MILYEDNHLLVVHKPNGLLVQGDRTGDKTILDQYKKYIKEKYNKPGAVFLHPAHRLDRPVSGCLILGRTSKGLERLAKQFQGNLIKKTYVALSEHEATHNEGKLEDRLLKNRKSNTVIVVGSDNEEGKDAVLHYDLYDRKSGKYLYRVNPQTGRSHQIRVQLATNGTPIIGDFKYRGPKIDDPKMIYLHCLAMEFMHPTKKEMMLVSCLPQKGKLWSIFDESLKKLIPQTPK